MAPLTFHLTIVDPRIATVGEPHAKALAQWRLDAAEIITYELNMMERAVAISPALHSVYHHREQSKRRNTIHSLATALMLDEIPAEVLKAHVINSFLISSDVLLSTSYRVGFVQHDSADDAANGLVQTLQAMDRAERQEHHQNAAHAPGQTDENRLSN